MAKMAALPAILRKTLTWDQGKEMANHAEIAEATDLDIYFCDPHSPWQRGTNENTNGLLRQYFAKGTDLSVFPADYLDYVAAKLNTRPRETLGWKTPAEALDELLSNPFKPRCCIEPLETAVRLRVLTRNSTGGVALALAAAQVVVGPPTERNCTEGCKPRPTALSAIRSIVTVRCHGVRRAMPLARNLDRHAVRHPSVGLTRWPMCAGR